MSRDKFDDNCPGCLPVLLDFHTGEPVPPDDPVMVAVMKGWRATTKQERIGWHRVTCNNSESPADRRLHLAVVGKIQAAMKEGTGVENALPGPG